MEASNVQKMREALIIAKKAICHHAEHICQSLSWENSDIQSNCADVSCAHGELCKAKTAINAALALPLRQCDVGTAEDQARRFETECRKYLCSHCSLNNNFPVAMCEIHWAQTPYAEEGADDDAV